MHRNTFNDDFGRINLLYTGNVQGVGFRFSFERIASELGVTGFVKNLPDGKVEAVCEGSKKNLDDLVKRVAERMSGYISSCRVNGGDFSGEFPDFTILS